MAPAQVQVVAGTRMRYDETNAKVYPAEKIVIHPDYVATALPNNVALIFVSERLSPKHSESALFFLVER